MVTDVYMSAIQLLTVLWSAQPVREGIFPLDIANVIWFWELLPLKTLHTKGIVYQMQKKYSVLIALSTFIDLKMTIPQKLSQYMETIEDY